MCLIDQVVVVDEAAQATEPSTLIPMQQLKTTHCVLVGDPQQLPATVLSKNLLALERSLFER